MGTLRRTFETNPDLFETFYLAEVLGKTVDHLLTGQDGPISSIEVVYWRAFFKKKAAMEKEASEKKSKSKDNSDAPPKMMGRR